MLVVKIGTFSFFMHKVLDKTIIEYISMIKFGYLNIRNCYAKVRGYENKAIWITSYL